MAKPKITKELIDRAIAWDPAAVREIVQRLDPVLRVRIGYMLLRAGDASRRDVDALCQDTLVMLLVDGGRRAQFWNPSGGLSFENFAGRLAKQVAVDFLRKRKEDLSWDDEFGRRSEPEVDTSRWPEAVVGSRELVELTYQLIQEEQTDVGRLMFEYIYVLGLEVPEVCERMQVQPDVVYAWRSRLARRMAELATEMGDAR